MFNLHVATVFPVLFSVGLSPCVLCCAYTLSHGWLFVTPQTVVCQAPLSMGFSRQEHWSGLPFPSPWDLPDPGIEPVSPVSLALTSGFFTTRATWEAPSVYIYSLCFEFPSHLGHYKALSRVPWAIHSVLTSYLFYTQHQSCLNGFNFRYIKKILDKCSLGFNYQNFQRKQI